MTRDELEVCRVFLAAWRRVEHNGRIEVWKREHKPADVRVMRGEQITCSATINVIPES